MEIFHSATTSSCNYDKGGDFKSLFFRLLSVVIIDRNSYEEFLFTDESIQLHTIQPDGIIESKLCFDSFAQTIMFVAYHEILLAFNVTIEE